MEELSDKPANSTQEGGNPSNGHAVDVVASTGINVEEQQVRTIARQRGDKAIDAKAIRGVCGMYGITANELEALAILETYLVLHDRVNVGAAERAIIDWSGARPGWKKKMRQAFAMAKHGGWVDEFRSKQGHAIDLTDKGRSVLDAYNRRYAEILEDLESKRWKLLLEKETKRLNKERKKKERERSRS